MKFIGRVEKVEVIAEPHKLWNGEPIEATYDSSKSIKLTIRVPFKYMENIESMYRSGIKNPDPILEMCVVDSEVEPASPPPSAHPLKDAPATKEDHW